VPRCSGPGAKTTQHRGALRPVTTALHQLMEALIVNLCQAMPIRQVAQLLGVGDMRLWRTLDYYVRGCPARQEDFSAVAAVGLDETAARARATTTISPVSRPRRGASAVRL